MWLLAARAVNTVDGDGDGRRPTMWLMNVKNPSIDYEVYYFHVYGYISRFDLISFRFESESGSVNRKYNFEIGFYNGCNISTMTFQYVLPPIIHFCGLVTRGLNHAIHGYLCYLHLLVCLLIVHLKWKHRFNRHTPVCPPTKQILKLWIQSS